MVSGVQVLEAPELRVLPLSPTPSRWSGQAFQVNTGNYFRRMSPVSGLSPGDKKNLDAIPIRRDAFLKQKPWLFSLEWGGANPPQTAPLLLSRRNNRVPLLLIITGLPSVLMSTMTAKVRKARLTLPV